MTRCKAGDGPGAASGRRPPRVALGVLAWALLLGGGLLLLLGPGACDREPTGHTSARPGLGLALRLPPEGVWEGAVATAQDDSTRAWLYALGTAETDPIVQRPSPADTTREPAASGAAGADEGLVLTLDPPVADAWWRLFVARGALEGLTTFRLPIEREEQIVQVVLTPTLPETDRIVVYAGFPAAAGAAPPAEASRLAPGSWLIPVAVENPAALTGLECSLRVTGVDSTSLYPDPGGRLYASGTSTAFEIELLPATGVPVGEALVWLTIQPAPGAPADAQIPAGCGVLFYVVAPEASGQPLLCIDPRTARLQPAAGGEPIAPAVCNPDGCPLQCDLTVSAPAAGAMFCEGEAVGIGWQEEGDQGPEVILELLQAGSACLTIADAAPNTGLFTWTAVRCGVAESGYQVRVTDPLTGASALNPGSFTIERPCSISVSTPAAGARYCPGEEVGIAWESTGCCGDSVEIELLLDGLACDLLASAAPNDGSFSWEARACGEATEGYAIRVSEAAGEAAGTSPGTFAIDPACGLTLLAPNGGETWCSGKTAAITWEANTCCGAEVALTLTRDGEACASISAAAPNTGRFDWSVTGCDGSGAGYRIRIEDLASGARDSSDAAFTIAAACSLTLLAPNGGEELCSGQAATITWEASICCAESLVLELLRSGTLCATIATCAAGAGQCSWTVAPCGAAELSYQVRLREVDGAGSDVSDGLFVILPPCDLSVTSPGAADAFCPGETVPIRWSASACCGDAVRLELLADGEPCLTIADALPNDRAYDWSAASCPDTAGPYRIRVTDLESGRSAESAETFTIHPACTLTVTQPNGGEAYCPGDAVAIAWEAGLCCADSVQIELLFAGLACDTLAAATANDGNFSWEAARCADTPDGYAIRVTDLESGVADGSDATFQIPDGCTVTVASPNGGEEFVVGEQTTITWSSSSCCGVVVRIDLVRDGAVCQMITGSATNDGDYPWTVAPCGEAEEGYRVRITDLTSEALDESDATFAIRATCALTVTDPTGGELLCVGRETSITWTRTGACGPTVRIELLRFEQTCATLAEAAENSGSFPWTVAACGETGAGYRVRVTDPESESSAASANTFRIEPECALRVTAPDGGETHCAGTEAEIRWEASECCGTTVTIELLQFDSLVQQLASAAPNNGAFAWTPEQVGSGSEGYWVRVTDPSSGTQDGSNEYFQIESPCSLGLVTPAGGEDLCPGDTLSITWTASPCCTDEVVVELLADDLPCLEIGRVDPTLGGLDWLVTGCDGAPGDYRIRLTDPSSGAIAEHTTPFTIHDPCALAVLTPPGGEFYCEFEPITITWSASDCCGTEVAIALLHNGTPCATLSGATPNDGFFEVDAEPCGGGPTGYGVRVLDLTTGASGLSEATFTIEVPAVTLLSPQGGTSYLEADPITIEWEVTACCGPTVVIELLHDGEACATIASVDAGNGVYVWPAERCTDDSEGYAIRVTDPESSARDESAATFGILAGSLLQNHDDSFEATFCAEPYMVNPPDEGMLAEAFCPEISGAILAVSLWLTETGTAPETIDIHVWEGGWVSAPTNPVASVTGVPLPDPLPAFPTIERVDLPVYIEVPGAFTVGFWTDWPTGECEFQLGADLDGPGPGSPWVYVNWMKERAVAWHSASDFFTPMVSFGIGVWWVPFLKGGEEPPEPRLLRVR